LFRKKINFIRKKRRGMLSGSGQAIKVKIKKRTTGVCKLQERVKKKIQDRSVLGWNEDRRLMHKKNSYLKRMGWPG